MKIHLVNTAKGLFIPESDYDFEQKLHLRIGETYVADIKLSRNSEFHRKYFAMLRKAWEYLPEELQYFYHDVDCFRKYCEMTAGYCDLYFNPKTEQWLEGPRSIAFDKLDQGEFEKLYMGVRNVLDAILTRYISSEDFESNFLSF